jgi:hypothetical protein
MTDEQVGVFGPKPWGPALDGCEMIPTPAGEACLYCKELIAEGDSGVTMVYRSDDRTQRVPEHRECHIRHIVGSVGHQQGRCSCFGGTEEDPVGITKREAAQAAVRFFTKGNPWSSTK